MTSFVVNTQLLGRIESIEIRYEEKIYDKVCEKYGVLQKSIDCYHSGQLIEADTLLHDSSLTADDNTIEVVANRKFRLYIMAMDIVELCPYDDELSCRYLFEELTLKKFNSNELPILLELLSILVENSCDDTHNPCRRYLEKLLFNFIKNDDCESVSVILRYATDNNYTPLIWSVMCKSYNVFLRLIDMGADVDEIDGEGDSPISIAAGKGLEKFLDKLLELGAKDVNMAFEKALVNSHSKICFKLFDKVSNYQRFLVSAAKYSLGVMEKLLERGVDIDLRDEQGETALVAAIGKRREKTAKLLISLGAKITDDLLHLAVENNNAHEIVSILLDKGVKIDDRSVLAVAKPGKYDLLEEFLERGANINAADDGKTIVSILIRKHEYDRAKDFIKRGADIDGLSVDDLTSLFFSSLYWDSEFFDLLLEKGADINAQRGRNGSTALIIAARNSRHQVVTKLIEAGADLDVTDNDGDTALVHALKKGHTHIAEKICLAGANPNIFGKKSPIYLAIDKYKFEMVKILLKCGANVNNPGENLLSKAFNYEAPKTIGNLLKHGADPNRGEFMFKLLSSYRFNTERIVPLLSNVPNIDANATDDSGKTLLMIASDRKHIGIVRWLIEKGADVNAVDQAGKNSLRYAKANLEIVEELLRAGADPGVSDKNGKSAISSVIKKGQEELYHKLLSHGAKIDPNKYLFCAIEAGSGNIMEDLLRRGADVNGKCDSKTPLMVALKNGDNNFARKLLELNPDVDCRDDLGNNALMYAMNGEIDEEIVLELVDRTKDLFGADTAEIKSWKVLEKLIMMKIRPINATIDGRTLLMRTVEHGDLTKAAKLIEMGADISIRDKHGIGMLDRALLNGDMEMFTKLSKKIA